VWRARALWAPSWRGTREARVSRAMAEREAREWFEARERESVVFVFLNYGFGFYFLELEVFLSLVIFFFFFSKIQTIKI
jgi:hypothetical protein